MVSTRSKSLQSTADYTDTENWLNELTAQFASAEITLLRQACAMAVPLYSKQHTLTGMPLLLHAIGAASILIGMRMDVETVTATLLHAVPEYLDDWYAQVENQFGVSIAELVKGISRMEQIRQFSEIEQLDASGGRGDQAQQIESLRQMLLAMVQDIRVVLIKLAERMQTMRYLSGASSKLQQRIASETRGIFAPLANRLGVWQIKWELEDLALRYLEPQLYKEIARLLDERRVDREQYIADVVAQLKQELLQANIKGEVSGRPKHIHSIINKMRRKNLEFNELYDIRAMRILVDDIKDCYAALGLVHHLWQPIPGEFDDYIARSKSNGYRSLHTAVIGPRGLALEVQIRTHDMHHNSELGVAAHWRYKEGSKSDSKFDEKIAWLRQILAWKDEVSDGGDLLEQFKSELFQDKVFVLTPQGKVIDLPKGSTPIDFAYALHTDLGHRTRGAKVDGRIVPLNTHLLNGQRVEILTSKLGAPSRDWLNPALGYLQSPRSRAKVRYWFKYQNFEENVAVGRVKLDRELHRAGVGSMNQEKLAHKLHYNHLEDLLAAIGRGDVSEHQIALVIQEATPPKPAEAPSVFTTKHMPPLKAPSGIVVEGVGNLLINLAKCCKPVPPDVIVGYITRDRGMSIHRQTCAFVTRLPEERHTRLLHAHWGAGANLVTSVDIEVEAHDRQGLLRDISDLFVREKVNATKVNATKGNTQSRSNLAKMQFSLEITNLDQLQRLLALIQQVPDVITARRRE
ncbi:GTP diphosphokinase [Nitrosomonas sp. Is37]|uniref:GTP diphosphokinase n=1 Tax=Nitrosomonas sp. Is37 TaxID=3080535 RepID=UPI00294B836B|nr:GTP diphosphokinase [Nitrosomonas sp. Is37]MDV6345090.1 GTP diphosphokinase [Nitrosomonas sp. Is37]